MVRNKLLAKLGSSSFGLYSFITYSQIIKNLEPYCIDQQDPPLHIMELEGDHCGPLITLSRIIVQMNSRMKST